MTWLRRLSWLAPLSLLGLLSLLPAVPDASACAPAYRLGGSVSIASESALILWDASSQTEQFIRRGTFRTASPDFGFLVPTPSEPKLDEADDRVFSQLEDWTKPEVVYRKVPAFSGSKMSRSAPGAAAMPAGSVAVLGEQRVAGLDAVKLQASDTKALQKWLAEHGYATRPALDSWLERYVRDGWVITAFKVAQPAGGRTEVATRALRMTFKTEKPFYPYREPEDMRAAGTGHGPRLLRVFVVSDARVEGLLGEDPAGWPGKAVWANPLAAGREGELARTLKLGEESKPAAGAWLTVFEDGSSPRPGTDELYFRTSADQGTLKRPPVIVNVPDYGAPPRQPSDIPVLPLALTLAGAVVLAAGIVAVCMLVSGRKARGG